MAYGTDKITKLKHLRELARRTAIKVAEVASAAAEAIEEIANAVSDLLTSRTDLETATRVNLWSDFQKHRTMEAEIAGEAKTVTLRNTQKQPFNSSVDNPTTVSLTTVRKNLFYSVEAEVTAHTGLVGEIQITDKALNGFKVSYTGSGSSVTLTLRIKGGMT